MPALATAPPIGITLGDPSGVGPQLVVDAIVNADPDLRRRLVVFGHEQVLQRAGASVFARGLPRDVTVVSPGALAVDSVPVGSPTREGAQAQVDYLEEAVRVAATGAVGALVTAPISKSQVRKVGWPFPGHTEFLAARLGGGPVVMMFVGPKLKVALATVHIPLADVSDTFTAERLRDVLTVTVDAARRHFQLPHPRIGVVGVNPHAGEAGLLGRQEQEVISPVLDRCAQELAPCELIGPLVPDAAFRDAANGRYDIVVAAYHDQGLIPVKLIDFEESVNVTLGLPIIRTSPDHGVAYDIAGSPEVRTTSFRAALRLAVALTDRATLPNG